MSMPKTATRTPFGRTSQSPIRTAATTLADAAKPAGPLNRQQKMNAVGVLLDIESETGKHKTLNYDKRLEVLYAVNAAVYNGESTVTLDLAAADLPDLAPHIRCLSSQSPPGEAVAPQPLPLPPADSKDSPELLAMFPVQVVIPGLDAAPAQATRAQQEQASPGLGLSESGQRMMTTILSNFAPLAHMRHVTPATHRLTKVVNGMLPAIDKQPERDKPVLFGQMRSCLDRLDGSIKGTPAAKSACLKLEVAANSTSEAAARFKEKNAHALQTYARHLDSNEPDCNPAMFSSKLSKFFGVQSHAIAMHQPPSERLALLAHLAACLDGIAQAFPAERLRIEGFVATELDAARNPMGAQETHNLPLNTALQVVMQPYLNQQAGH